MKPVHATTSSDVFLAAKNPYVPKTLRTKTWRFLVPPVHDNDPVWTQRCIEYWQRQERIYGVILSDCVMLVDWEGGFISTYATVLAVVPGERTANKHNVTFIKQGGRLH